MTVKWFEKIITYDATKEKEMKWAPFFVMALGVTTFILNTESILHNGFNNPFWMTIGYCYSIICFVISYSWRKHGNITLTYLKEDFHLKPKGDINVSKR
jgi:hypothetical protein